MLRALSIRRIVIVDALDLEFEAGLMVLTGETGAGKSILLDSLGLALGARADAGLVQPGADAASVVAEFDLPETHPVLAMLENAELSTEGPLLLRRTLGADGRSRAFINDQPVSVNLLRTVGNLCAEIHGQFEQHGLLNPLRHGEILDAAAGLGEMAADVGKLWTDWRQAADALQDAQARADAAKRDEAFLRHAAEELEALAPQPEEEENLSNQRAFLMGRSRLFDALKTAATALDKADAANAIRKGERALARAAEAAEGRFDTVLAALERAGIELDEAERALDVATQDLGADTGSLEDVDGRLFSLRDMARKHNVPPTGLPELLEKFRQDIELIDRTDDRLAELQEQAKALQERYHALATELSEKRKAAAKQLQAAVLKELPPLKLDRADLDVEVGALDESGWGPNGMDRVRFLARTNPGQAFGAMHKVASGGELARFALALRVVLAENGVAGSLIFDEVDAGVGGATAAAVGERLKRLSMGVQALVITHSPQVAALGNRHYQVEKDEANGRVSTTVRELTGKARQEEIARMLSGAEITKEARAQADRLLGEA
ncbi:MAG: DNA repair protein RecN [Alphaproteobacteria bacterium]